jgi:hypothetical protein
MPHRNPPRKAATRSPRPAPPLPSGPPLRILVSELLSGLRAISLDPATPGSPGQTQRWASMDTPFGPMLLSERDGSLASICFLDGREPGRVLAGLKDRWLEAQFVENAAALEPFRRFLVRAMGGELPRYHPLPRETAATAQA